MTDALDRELAALPIKGSVRVYAEIRKLLDGYGDADIAAARSMLEHWANLLATEMSDDIKARIPEIQAQINAIDNAKFVSRTLLTERITI